MYTLGTTPKTICKLEESYSINIGVVASAIFQRGQVVKLKTNGEVEAVGATSDKPFGLVVAGNKAVGEQVTVQTEFNAVVRCKADGAVTTGDEIAVSGLDAADEKLTKAKVAVSGDYIAGVALDTVANGESVMVGFYRVTTKKA